MKPASQYPTTIAKPTTPNETQELSDNPRFRTWYKGTLTRSEIYERMLPDKVSGALRIDGPEDSAIVQDSLGCIRLLTGVRNPEKGPGSGKLCVKTWGYQAKHHQRSNLEFNKGDDKEGQALNLVCYGDYVEQSIGSTRYIRAQKIMIEASEELLLIGKTQVNIQSGTNGGGAIYMNAGTIERVTDNDKEIVTGQKMTFGVSEETSVQFDPRASQNIVSPGHINWSILGDYKQWIGGIEQHIVAGKISTPPLIKSRDSAYSVKTVIGGQKYDSADFIQNKVGLNYSVTAGGTVDITGVGTVNIKGALILLN